MKKSNQDLLIRRDYQLDSLDKEIFQKIVNDKNNNNNQDPRNNQASYYNN